MKVKTFWSILLKVIGLFLIMKGVTVLIYSFSTLLMISSTVRQGMIGFALVFVLIVLIYLFILWLFVFKTSWLIDKLHLVRGFEEDKVETNIQLTNILSVAIIVIGGIMLIQSLPQLCQQIFTFFQMKDILKESQTIGLIILYFLQTCLGYLLMTNSKKITTLINKRAYSDSSNDNEQND